MSYFLQDEMNLLDSLLYARMEKASLGNDSPVTVKEVEDEYISRYDFPKFYGFVKSTLEAFVKVGLAKRYGNGYLPMLPVGKAEALEVQMRLPEVIPERPGADRMLRYTEEKVTPPIPWPFRDEDIWRGLVK